jgi:hypothetical protein
MAELPYRSEHVTDAIADADDLTNEELGALLRIRWALHRAGGYLPASGKRLARIARAGNRWGAIAPSVMGKLVTAEGLVSCTTILTMLDLARQRRDAAAKARAGRRRADGGLDQIQRGGLDSSKPLILQDRGPTRQAASGPQSKSESSALSFSPPGDAAVPLTRVDFFVDLVTKRSGRRRREADQQVRVWLRKTDSRDRLEELLKAAEHQNLQGEDFIGWVDQRASADQEARESGPRLPLIGGGRDG